MNNFNPIRIIDPITGGKYNIGDKVKIKEPYHMIGKIISSEKRFVGYDKYSYTYLVSIIEGMGQGMSGKFSEEELCPVESEE